MGFLQQRGRMVRSVVEREIRLLGEDVLDAGAYCRDALRNLGLLLLGKRKFKRGDCWAIGGVILLGCLLGYFLAFHVARCMSGSGSVSSSSCSWTFLHIRLRARLVKSTAELVACPFPLPFPLPFPALLLPPSLCPSCPPFPLIPPLLAPLAPLSLLFEAYLPPCFLSPSAFTFTFTFTPFTFIFTVGPFRLVPSYACAGSQGLVSIQQLLPCILLLWRFPKTLGHFLPRRCLHVPQRQQLVVKSPSLVHG